MVALPSFSANSSGTTGSVAPGAGLCSRAWSLSFLPVHRVGRLHDAPLLDRRPAGVEVFRVDLGLGAGREAERVPGPRPARVGDHLGLEALKSVDHAVHLRPPPWTATPG